MSNLICRVSDITPITAHEMQVLHGASELSMFMDVLLSELRGIQFGQNDTRTVYVYRPDDVYPLGLIGYGDWKDTGEPVDTFIVMARTIENNKYSAYNTQHRMKMTINLDTAVKSAKKFLRPWTTQEMATSMWEGCKRAWHQAKHNAEEPLNDLKRKVFDNVYGRMDKPMHRELIHLARSGHQFMDSDFHQNINAYVKLSDELSDLHESRQHKFIRVYKRWGEVYADIVYVDSSKAYGGVELLNFMTYAEKDIPEEDAGRVAVLQMMPPVEYVLNVGCNMGDGVFYATV
jgi:hypothetical protein